MFGSCFWIVGKAADLGRNGQEQNQEAQRNHGTHLHVLFLLPLRTLWKFTAVSRLSLASSGYSWWQEASVRLSSLVFEPSCHAFQPHISETQP